MGGARSEDRPPQVPQDARQRDEPLQARHHRAADGAYRLDGQVRPRVRLWRRLLHRLDGEARRPGHGDRDEPLRDRSRELLRGAGRRGRPVRVVPGNAEKDTVEGQYDFIFAKDLVEHLEDDGPFFRRLAQQLKPGGRTYIATQNDHSLNYLLEGTYERIYRHNKSWCGWDRTHKRFYNAPMLAARLRAVGIAPESWGSSYLVPWRFVSKRLTGKARPWKGGSISTARPAPSADLPAGVGRSWSSEEKPARATIRAPLLVGALDSRSTTESTPRRLPRAPSQRDLRIALAGFLRQVLASVLDTRADKAPTGKGLPRDP